MKFIKIPNYNMAYGESPISEGAPFSYYDGFDKLASIDDAFLAGYEAGFCKVAGFKDLVKAEKAIGGASQKVQRQATKAVKDTVKSKGVVGNKNLTAERKAQLNNSANHIQHKANYGTTNNTTRNATENTAEATLKRRAGMDNRSAGREERSQQRAIDRSSKGGAEVIQQKRQARKQELTQQYAQAQQKNSVKREAGKKQYEQNHSVEGTLKHGVDWAKKNPHTAMGVAGAAYLATKNN